MPEPSLSTDQVASLVALAREGSLARAAVALFITEQGVRNRLLALEHAVGRELYVKRRGMRHNTPLTAAGRQLLPQAEAFLARAREMCEHFAASDIRGEIHVVASHYLTLFLLLDVVRRFHRRFPAARIKLITRTEQEIEELLLRDSDISMGIAAPHDPSPELEYDHLFDLSWSVIAPRGYRWPKGDKVRLAGLAHEPLILYERGSTGRQHVIDAFQQRGLAPRVELEATHTETIVRMVESGLGVSVVPLLASGIVTRGRRVSIRPLQDHVRPIRSGILTRRGQQLLPAAAAFVQFVHQCCRSLLRPGKPSRS